MLRFFRKLREDNLGEKTMKKYILYGFGEIVLVVVGILLALQIDNWNEDKKQEAVLKNILAVIADDMKKDSLQIDLIVDFYDGRKELYDQVINGELSKADLKSCRDCGSLLTVVRSMAINDRGYKQLLDFKSSVTTHDDSLLSLIDQVYSVFIKNIGLFDKQKNDDIFGILNEWRAEHAWFSDLMSGKKPDDSYFDYVANSSDYKNKIVWHSLLVYGNYVPILKQYDANLRILLKRINSRIGK